MCELSNDAINPFLATSLPCQATKEPNLQLYIPPADVLVATKLLHVILQNPAESRRDPLILAI